MVVYLWEVVEILAISSYLLRLNFNIVVLNFIVFICSFLEDKKNIKIQKEHYEDSYKWH